MNYEKSSDFEINKAVAEALGFDTDSKYWQEGFDGKGTLLQLSESGKTHELNYCNNPNDAWPIIVENKISVNHSSIYGYSFDGWEASAYNDTDGLISANGDKNPLRAAMIVFLKMKESDNG